MAPSIEAPEKQAMTSPALPGIPSSSDSATTETLVEAIKAP